MDLYLIRHGACRRFAMEYYDEKKRTMDPPLTSKGFKQAEKLALRCKDIGFDFVCSSDLSRAIQTAEVICSCAPCDLSITPAFREIDMGDVCLQSWSHYPDVYAKWLLHTDDIPYPNGENGEDVWNRCKTELNSIAQAGHEKVAIVCHGGTIRSIVCGVLKIPQQKRFYFGAPLENCSMSVVKYNKNDQRYCLHSFNDSFHLSR